jgi:RNA polymerase sigma-70 factor (ECF subfamily)
MARRPQKKPVFAADEPIVLAFNGVRDELVSTLAYMLGSRDDAQDAAQEAFLKCWRAKASLPDVQNLRAWIFRVAMNAARDYQRSGWNKRSRPLIAEESTVTSRDAAVSDQMVDDEQVRALRKALLELRDEEREIFLLRQNGELTYEEIAVERNVPVGTVKTQMRTALIKLRKALNPEAADAALPEE